jgi:DNA-binding PadR family transcriptional regulator
MFHRQFYGHAGRAYMFERGDLKFVILDLLKDKPSHGYEIIKNLEGRFHGFYAPSAGSVYPTLQLLEDMGYVTSAERDGKKVYTITDAGKAFLEEKQKDINHIKDHMRHWCDAGNFEEMRDTMHEFRSLGRMMSHRMQKLDPEKMKKIKEIIAKAGSDIEKVLE